MSKRIPSYRLHRQSGQGIVTLRDPLGRVRDVLLGQFDTPESREKYARVIAEWEARGRRFEGDQRNRDTTIEQLIALFIPHIEQHYRHADGSHTSEVQAFALSLRPLRHHYGSSSVADFGPLALKAVREITISGYNQPTYGVQPSLSRKLINQRVGRINKARELMRSIG